MGKHVVGYLIWKDFLEEVREMRPRVIRVQTYHRAEGKRPPLAIRFWAEASFISRDEVHVARFLLGSTPDFELRNDPALRERFAALMADAEAILRAALSPYALIRPGVFAGADRIKIRTSPEGLWRFERADGEWRLVPEVSQEVQA